MIESRALLRSNLALELINKQFVNLFNSLFPTVSFFSINFVYQLRNNISLHIVSLRMYRWMSSM